MILRLLARPLMVAPFIIDSADAITNPHPHVEMVRPLAEKAEEHGAPPLLDSDLATITRVAGVATAAAGLAYGLGKRPVLSALLLTTLNLPVAIARNPLWQAKTASRKRDCVAGLARSGAALAGIWFAATGSRRKRKK